MTHLRAGNLIVFVIFCCIHELDLCLFSMPSKFFYVTYFDKLYQQSTKIATPDYRYMYVNCGRIILYLTSGLFKMQHKLWVIVFSNWTVRRTLYNFWFSTQLKLKPLTKILNDWRYIEIAQSPMHSWVVVLAVSLNLFY